MLPDETIVAEVPTPRPKNKGGRPKKRRDPPPAPIDGDYRNDAISNKEAGWDYGLIADRERGKYLARGWQVERYGAGCARPKWDYNEHKNGDEVRVNNQLTLMKIPTALREQINNQERQWHTEAKAALKRAATDSGGKHLSMPGVRF
jgi:hypothetical protein